MIFCMKNDSAWYAGSISGVGLGVGIGAGSVNSGISSALKFLETPKIEEFATNRIPAQKSAHSIKKNKAIASDDPSLPVFTSILALI